MKPYDTKKPGGRPRTGSLEVAGTWPSGAPRFRVRLRLGDGTKGKRYDVPEGLGEDAARKWAAAFQAEEDARGLALAEKRNAARVAAAESLIPHELETCDAWFARRESRSEDRARWNKWISPVIGDKPFATLSKDDVELVRDALDVGLRENRLAPKSAVSVWSVLTSSMRLASAGKDRSLRVRADNPCIGVLPPDAGESRRRSWLYPSEVARLLACEDVPRAWREVYAIACYSYVRPGELVALDWTDIDLVANVIRITKAHDWSAGEMKAPKTRNGTREIPIAPTLRPLLERMRGVGRLVPMLSRHKTAGIFRAHLRAAGIDRVGLFDKTPTTEPIDFRSLRDTGITWLALAGVDVTKIQRRAGHDDLNTTMRYVKAAEDFTGSVGDPFPALPEALVWPKVWPKEETLPNDSGRVPVEALGIEPRSESRVLPASTCVVGDLLRTGSRSSTTSPRR